MLCTAAAAFLSSSGFDGLFALVGALAFAGGMFALVIYSYWEKYTLKGFGYFCCGVFFFFTTIAFAVHSTWPSSAPRREITGRVAWVQAYKHGKSTDYTFGVDLDHADGEKAVQLPFRGDAVPPLGEGGETVWVKYLDEHKAGLYARAIAVTVLDGPDAGRMRSVSADWLGPWLGVPFSVASAGILFWTASRNPRPRKRVAEDPHKG